MIPYLKIHLLTKNALLVTLKSIHTAFSWSLTDMHRVVEVSRVPHTGS